MCRQKNFRLFSVPRAKKFDDHCAKIITVKIIFFFKKVRNAAKARIPLIRDSPYVPRTRQMQLNSSFCVPAKVIKLVGLKNKGGLSPINLVTFAVTQNDE
jgi:hypothetical protein